MPDFKDVGFKTYGTKLINSTRQISAPTPIGIKTPMEYGTNGTDTFWMHTKIEDQIADNLRNLILTNHGERLGRYLYGANLKELLFEFTTQDDFDNEVGLRINTAISSWMPFIEPIRFDTKPLFNSNNGIAQVQIILLYNVSKLNMFGKALNIVLAVGG